MKQTFDLVIVGGAMTGSVLALALSSATKQKMKIAIVEKTQANYAEQGGFDARSIALAYGSLQKMAKIQPLAQRNLADLVREIATPIQHIQVSDQGHFGKTHLDAKELGLTELGVVVELAKLGVMLNQLLEQHQNISLFCPDNIQQLTRHQDYCDIQLASGIQLHSQLIVAADGIQSQLAKQCGVETLIVKDYQQSAIIANVELSEAHQCHAFERFTTQGPFALLPLTEKTMSLVWCVNDPTPQMAMDDSTFLAQLQQQFGWKLGKFKRVSKRFVYPLSSQKAESHIHHRLAIVGNAAQLLHPVAGQGFNLGMRDLFELSTLVSQAFLAGQDLGDSELLNRFENARQDDQQRIMQSTSGLISVFCCEFLPIQILRNLALIGLNHSQLARNQIAHRALGW